MFKKTCENSMLCYNPGTDQVTLIPWPDTRGFAHLYDHCLIFSINVCEMTFEQRKSHLYITAMHLIIRSKCDPKAVHNAFLELEEYASGFTEDRSYLII